MLQCIFYEYECIPLWPQYDHFTTSGKFIKVDTQEWWLQRFVAAMRKSSGRDHDKNEKEKYSIGLVKAVCKCILSEFRRVLNETRGLQKKSTGMRLPDVFGISMHCCEMTASTALAQQFYIQVDDSSIRWIQSGLQEAVESYSTKHMRL